MEHDGFEINKPLAYNYAYPVALHPKARIMFRCGRSSDLFQVLRPSRQNCQWQEFAYLLKKLTATGIVPDFNRIPF